MKEGLRRSPTLELAASICAARQEGRTVYSLSTPTFPERDIALPGDACPGTTLSPGIGKAELRERSRESLFGKWHLPRHECVISGGAKASIFCILRTKVPAGRSALIVSPHWPSYEDLAELAHLRPVFFSTRAGDDFSIDAGRLRGALRETRAGAVICSNPGNPTGRILDQCEIESLISATAEYGAVLLLDESFCKIVFDDEKWQASVCSSAEHLFVISSFSKNFRAQGLRLSAFLAHRNGMEPIIAAHQALVSAAPTPSQDIALRILDNGPCVADNYGEQRQLVLKFLNANGWRNSCSEGGFHLFPRLGKVNRFRQLLAVRNVLSLPGEAFGRGYEDHLRLCFGKPEAEMRALIDILNDASMALRCLENDS